MGVPSARAPPGGPAAKAVLATGSLVARICREHVRLPSMPLVEAVTVGQRVGARRRRPSTGRPEVQFAQSPGLSRHGARRPGLACTGTPERLTEHRRVRPGPKVSRTTAVASSKDVRVRRSRPRRQHMSDLTSRPGRSISTRSACSTRESSKDRRVTPSTWSILTGTTSSSPTKPEDPHRSEVRASRPLGPAWEPTSVGRADRRG